MKNKKNILIACAVLLLLALSVPLVLATVGGAKERAYSIADRLLGLGFNVLDTYQYGLLPRGGAYVVTTTLQAGVSYVFVAGGCQDAYDVDVGLFDENGNLIDVDEDNSTLAVAEVTPKWTGPFYIKIVMHDSTRNGAHWVLLTAYK
ncbi:MAG: hypothetical protein AB1896_17090 [Thermodesulfobacteriota bacterium]